MPFNVSQSDIDKLNRRDNPPSTEPGFEQEETNSAFDFFDNSSDIFSQNNSGNTFGNNSNNTFGNTNNGGGMFSPTPFPGQTNVQKEEKKDYFDAGIEAAWDTSKTAWSLIKELPASIKLRSADDIGEFSTSLIKIGALMGVGGILVSIVGTITKISLLSFSGIPLQVALGGGLIACSGVSLIGYAALRLVNLSEKEDMYTVENSPDIPGSLADEIEQKSGSLFEHNIAEDLSGEYAWEDEQEDTDESGGFDFTFDETEEEKEEFTPSFNDLSDKPFDMDSALEKVPENQVLTRERLFDVFKSLLPLCTPGFADVTVIEEGTSEWTQIKASCMKAVAITLGIQIDEVDSSIELISASKTIFSYDIRMTRVTKIKKLEDFSREISNCMESYDDDLGKKIYPNVNVSIEADEFHIIISLGTSAIVSFGDVFRHKEYCDYMLNPKRKLPFIGGIDELGHVIFEDAKGVEAMMITGPQASGKSWYTISILMMLMLFNSPEELQFIVIDPKQSMFFNTLALMPHVAGLHTEESVLRIMGEIIDIEAPRRKKILNDWECEDIWELKKKGVKLPILYLVMDEYITIKNTLSAKDPELVKELDNKFQIILSELRFVGIRVLFVPHRAVDVVKKTNRIFIHFASAVMAQNDAIEEALGIRGWKRALTQKGDIAYKINSRQEALYVRGAVLTDSDENNRRFIKMAAQAFYKMGVELPDMSAMKFSCNRNEAEVRKKLLGDVNRIQYSKDNIFDGLDDMEISNIEDDLDLKVKLTKKEVEKVSKRFDDDFVDFETDWDSWGNNN